MISISNIIDKSKLKTNISITGMTDDFFGVYLYNLLEEKKDNILVVMPSLYEANKLMESIENYTDQVLLFPMDDFLTSEAVSLSPDLMITRLETMNAICHGSKKNIVITHLEGFTHYLPPKKEFETSSLNIKKGDELSPNRIIEHLNYLGYHRETLVTSTGEFGVRGFVIDVFALGKDHPYRIEFFGDEIESIKEFDERTQRSIKEVDEISITAITDVLTTDEKHKKSKFYCNKEHNVIYDYLDDPIVVWKDYSQDLEKYKQILETTDEYREMKDTDFDGDYFASLDDIKIKNKIDYLSISNLSLGKKIDFKVGKVPNFEENIDLLKKYIDKNVNKTIVFCVTVRQMQNLKKILPYECVETGFANLHVDEINFVLSDLQEGFTYENYIFLSQRDIFKIKKKEKKYKTNYKYSSKIYDINKLSIGDYVVHDVHGIGIYNGIKALKQNGLLKDYIEILFQGTDKLYIPVEKIDYISKFTGKEGAVPKISKLGGKDWQKTKARVRSKVKDIAKSLIKINALRKLQKGFAFEKDDEYQELFEQEFEYTLTPDQELAIRQIKEDMESPSPMDRLLCGDVGYGKTEVAFRAIFKAILSSKQVLYLCPTTILSNQHYENALERFKNYPVNIGLLNRFTTTKEKNRIVKGLEDGTIDFVIGTHRLLSDDIKPKSLGLLVIDEEQRFGVTHKEKIKQYKANVDVLTLTATPIPRTLQMSMVGLRSLSLIETPPMNRYPVQTYVIEDSMPIVKDAVYKEIARNGQIFYLYNRVETIQNEVLKLKTVFPDITIDFVHGQLSKELIETKMEKFINHEIDLLVCTTIIETGLDISNANTLIIKDADRFGLSQLYQLRGRVGRSDRIAYAYLMYDARKILNDVAKKRLDVIKRFTELGSGFAIATRDLSIRGAGDILGSEQAGFIDSVGIDLYLKILNDEVERLKGNEILEEESKPEVSSLQVSTHIDDKYVDDEDLKIEIHRLINSVCSKETFEKVKAELEDRFGKVDDTIVTYMYEEWFEKLCIKYDVEKISQTKTFVELVFSSTITEKIDTEKLFMDSVNISNMFRFKALNNKLVLILDIIRLEEDYIPYLISILSTLSYLDEN